MTEDVEDFGALVEGCYQVVDVGSGGEEAEGGAEGPFAHEVEGEEVCWWRGLAVCWVMRRERVKWVGRLY